MRFHGLEKLPFCKGSNQVSGMPLVHYINKTKQEIRKWCNKMNPIFLFVCVHLFYYLIFFILRTNPSSPSIPSSYPLPLLPLHTLHPLFRVGRASRGVNKIWHTKLHQDRATPVFNKTSKVSHYKEWAPESQFTHPG